MKDMKEGKVTKNVRQAASITNNQPARPQQE
jgi:hypothetical protein